ncbi:MAG: CRISPR-associated protein Cas4 [Candidatus Helarchaeota archaeon]
MTQETLVYLTTRDVQEYVYCPRFIYFTRVMQLRPLPTYKMQRGNSRHEQFIRRQTHAKEAGLEKYYNLYLRDDELGLIGLLDYLELDGDELVPVEYKTGNPQPGTEEDYHKAQLVAQALLVERHFHRFVRHVKVIYEKLPTPVIYELSGVEKVQILQILEEIRAIIQKELMPPPTPHEAKCQDCEFWRVCLRV